MKTFGIVSVLLSFLLLPSCATTPSFVGADETARAWDEIYECVRTAPPGKSCGSQFKSRVYTARISTIQKDESGHTQVVTRFGPADKVFMCEFPEEKKDQFAEGDLIQFEGTVTGIVAKPIQRFIEFKNCHFRRAGTS